MEDQVRKENTEQAEPESLYHYTTLEGLLGILEKKKIWATNIRYLNDTKENRIIANLLSDELKRRCGHGTFFDLLAPNRNEEMNRNEPASVDSLLYGDFVAKWLASLFVFVTSFSKKGDSLSQWRAYSGRSGGYSIGFRPEYLKAVGENFTDGRSERPYSDLRPLSKCDYVDEEVERSLKNEIKELVAAFIKESTPIQKSLGISAPERSIALTKLAFKSFIGLGRRSAFLKDDGFAEESEWRLAFHLSPNPTPPDLKFRSGSSMLVPYLEVPLEVPDQLIGIEEVIVGPCPHRSEAKQAVEILLTTIGLPDVKARCSKVPYRNW